MLSPLERKLIKAFFRLGIADYLPESVVYGIGAPSPSHRPKHGFRCYHPQPRAWERYCLAQRCEFRGISAPYGTSSHIHTVINLRSSLRAAQAAYDSLSRTPAGQAALDALIGDLATMKGGCDDQ